MWSYPWVWRWPDYNFGFPPIIKMANTWRLIFFQLFFQNFLETWYIYIYRFLGSASLLVLSVFMWDWKRGCGGHFGFIIFNKSFLFSINCLQTWHIESLHQPRGIWVLAQYFFISPFHFCLKTQFFFLRLKIACPLKTITFLSLKKKQSLLRSPHFWGLAIPIFEGAIPNNKHDYSGPHFFINFSNKIFLLSTFSRNFSPSFVPLLRYSIFS